MTNRWALAGTVVAGAFLSASALAQPACVTQNMGVPPGANTTDKAAPFFIDTTGLDFKTSRRRAIRRTRTIRARRSWPTAPCRPRARRGTSSSGPRMRPRPRRSRRTACRRARCRVVHDLVEGQHIYNPGLIRDDVAGCGNSSIMTTTTAPGNKSNMIVTTSHPGTWTRTIDVYVPAHYRPGTLAPFIVIGDGGSNAWKDVNVTLDNLIQQKRVPAMIAIQIGNGGQDAQGAQRGKEYDTVSGVYTDFVEREVLPLVEQRAKVKLTKNPDGRATMGLSSSGAAAFTMAWFHPELYHRVLAYSPTMVNQQWPYDPSLRGGAWEYHSAWTGTATPSLTVKAGRPRGQYSCRPIRPACR
jgi:hypothetical protein